MNDIRKSKIAHLVAMFIVTVMGALTLSVGVSQSANAVTCVGDVCPRRRWRRSRRRCGSV